MTTAGAVRGTGSDIRILLVGRTGHGKSSTANSLLGEDKFKTSSGAKSETCTTQWSGVYERHGRTIEVVDTPGFYDTHKSDREIYKELVRSLLFTTPGFHAIAFVFEKGRFTEELVKTKDLFFNWFGKGVEKYACIILTKTEKEEDVDEYVKPGNATKDLVDLVQKCGGRKRIAYIENKAGDEKQRESQVLGIIRMVEQIKLDNNNTHFTNLTFMLANAYANNYRSEEITIDTISILRKAKEHICKEERKMLTGVFELNDHLQRRFDDLPEHLKLLEIGVEKRNAAHDRSFPNYSVDMPINKTYNLARDDERGQFDVEAQASDHLNDYKRGLESGQEDESDERGQFDVEAQASDHLNDYKRDLESGQEDESGFFNFMKNAWSFCKQKISGCILM